MNQFGLAKLIEKKNVAEAFSSGHGSPFVAQVSMANAAKLYKAMLDGLEYRGTAFFQAYTTCQPEHGVGDNVSADRAKMVREPCSRIQERGGQHSVGQASRLSPCFRNSGTE